MQTDLDYWTESVFYGAEECGLNLTRKQAECIAESVSISHENYSMAFYSPPASDRFSDIEREWKAKYLELQKKYDDYVQRSDIAIKRGFKLRDDTIISVDPYGNVEIS